MIKCGASRLQVVKNHNFVTMDQMEEDKEIVEFCRKSLTYRKQLEGEEHEVRATPGRPAANQRSHDIIANPGQKLTANQRSRNEHDRT